jgi:5-methylcytosine-specific restriction endonuclease McrA
MDSYALSHLSDAVLLRSLADLLDHYRRATAMVLAHIAEVDARQLFRGSGCGSMHAYCVDKLHLSDDAAYKRIQAARAARQFPALFEAVAAGRLHLTAVCLLAPHLTPGNAEELIEAATHRRKAEIEAWLARRFEVVRDAGPVRPMIRAIPGAVQLAPAQVDEDQLQLTAVDERFTFPLTQVDVNGGVGVSDDGEAHGGSELVPAQVRGSVPERYLIRLAISKSTHDKLRRAQALLSYAVPAGDVAQVLDRALDALIADVEKKRFGAKKRDPRPSGAIRPIPDQHRPKSQTANQAPPRRAGVNRYIPAPIRRAVWERDGAQCTFVAATGCRCETRHFLEFDHVKPIAKGGKATVDGLRLRCQAHNQYEAERAFGAEFMRRKRDKARSAAEPDMGSIRGETGA